MDADKKYYCEIGNDVWIATRATLVCGKNGLKIGDGAIIRGGAVVTKDIPPYAIVQGVPAQIVGYRFDEKTIANLLELKWWEKDANWLAQHTHLFGSPTKLIEQIQKEKYVQKALE